MKGLSLNYPIVMLALLILVGVLVSTVISDTFKAEAEEQEKEYQENLEEFDRGVELTPKYQGLAREQLRAITYLVTLRSINCRALEAAISDGTGVDYGDISEGEEHDLNDFNLLTVDQDTGALKFGDSNPDNHYELLAPATSLDDKSVYNLECKGQESIVEMSGFDEVQEFRNNPLKWGTEEIVVEPARSFLGLGNANTLEDKVADQDFNSQPGKFGNVGFYYPELYSDGVKNKEPIVIPAEDFQLKPSSVGKLPGSSGNAGDLGTATIEEGDQFPDGVDKPGATFADIKGWISSSGTFFAPGAEISHWSRRDTLSPIPFLDGNEDADFPYSDSYLGKNDFRKYPVYPGQVAMDNVLMITNEPLRNDTTGLSRLRDVVYWGKNQNSDFGPLNPINFLARLNNVYASTGVQEYIPAPSDLHRNYEFVICPGSSGNIQSNINKPYYDGNAKNGMERPDLAYPFISLDKDSSKNCVTDYELGFPWKKAENFDTGTERYVFESVEPQKTETFNFGDFSENEHIDADAYFGGTVSLRGDQPEIELALQETIMAQHVDLQEVQRVDLNVSIFYYDLYDQEGNQRDNPAVHFSDAVMRESHLTDQDTQTLGTKVDLSQHGSNLAPGDQILVMTSIEAPEQAQVPCYKNRDKCEVSTHSTEFTLEEGSFTFQDVGSGGTTGEELFNNNNVDCESYRDVRESAKIIQHSNGNFYSLMCGVSQVGDGSPDNLYRFQGYVRKGKSDFSCRPIIKEVSDGFTDNDGNSYSGKVIFSELTDEANAVYSETLNTEGIELECHYASVSDSMYTDSVSGVDGTTGAEYFTCETDGSINGLSSTPLDNLVDEAEDFCGSLDFDRLEAVAIYIIGERSYFPVKGDEEFDQSFINETSSGERVFMDVQFQSLREAEKRYGHSTVENVNIGDLPDPPDLSQCDRYWPKGEPTPPNVDYTCIQLDPTGMGVPPDYDTTPYTHWVTRNAGGGSGVSSSGGVLSDPGFFPGGFAGDCAQGETWSYTGGGWSCGS